MSPLLHIPGTTALVLVGGCVHGADKKTAPVGNLAPQQMLLEAWFKSSLPVLPPRAAQRAPM